MHSWPLVHVSDRTRKDLASVQIRNHSNNWPNQVIGRSTVDTSSLTTAPNALFRRAQFQHALLKSHFHYAHTVQDHSPSRVIPESWVLVVNKAKRRKMGLLLCISACSWSSCVGCGTVAVADVVLAIGNYDKKNTPDEASPFFLYRCRLLGRPLYQIVGGIVQLILLGLCLPLLSRCERGGVMNYGTLGLWTGALLEPCWDLPPFGLFAS
jgi:hypothetical protein